MPFILKHCDVTEILVLKYSPSTVKVTLQASHSCYFHVPVIIWLGAHMLLHVGRPQRSQQGRADVPMHIHAAEIVRRAQLRRVA